MQYILNTSIPHSLNIPPNTATNEENMYRNTTDPSSDVFLLFSRMVMIIGIMRNDILKLVRWLVAYVWRWNYSLHDNSSTNEAISQLLQTKYKWNNPQHRRDYSELSYQRFSFLSSSHPVVCETISLWFQLHKQ